MKNNGTIPLMGSYKMPAMVWSPLSGGKLFMGDQYKNTRDVLEKVAYKYNTDLTTIAYAWLLYHPNKFIPISGSRDIMKLEKAINAVSINLQHEDWYKIYSSSGQALLK